ncbi:MAG TPA: hypothetical protein VGG94_06525 [Chthoniobacterales bacterium]
MKKSFAALTIFIAVAAVYAPAARDGFVWDDTALILRDPLIRSWRLIPEGFNHFLFVDATASDFYRPVQRLTYTLEYAAFAFAPAAYHVTNVLLHAAAAVALLFFADELLLAFGVAAGVRRWVAPVAVLIWAIHPVQSAAVVYVSGRADPLAALFGFLGCFLILRSRTSSPRSTLAFLLGSTIAFLLAALSKESGLIFLSVAAVTTALLHDKKTFLRGLAATAFVAIVYCSLRQAADHQPSPPSLTSVSLAARPIRVARAFAEYAGLVAWPLHLHMEREVEARPIDSTEDNTNNFVMRELQTALGVLLMGGMVYWTMRARRHNPPVFKLLALGWLTYLPISGVVTLNASVAEHWIYVPSAFLFLAATQQAVSLWEARRWHAAIVRAGVPALACWMAFLAARTCVRTFDWKDQRTFLERTIAAEGASPRMLINLGGLELSEGHLDRAKILLDSALKMEPDQPLAVMNLAVVALRQKDFKTSRELARRATQMPWVEAQSQELLAVLDHKEKGETNPLRLRLAARTGPPNWEIEKRYVRFMNESGSTPAAIHELQTCLQTQWYRAESWQLLGQLLSKAGLVNEAAIAQRQAANYDVHLTDRNLL